MRVMPPRQVAGQKRASAFALIPSKDGPRLAPAQDVLAMLRKDWALFLELAAYALHDYPEQVAFGPEEVSEACAQEAVAVLFVTAACGSAGEVAVKRVASSGGRGYIVGQTNPLYEDLHQWGTAAVLSARLSELRVTEEEVQAKRRKREEEAAVAYGAATAKAPPTAPPTKPAVEAGLATEVPAADPAPGLSMAGDIPQPKDDEQGLQLMLRSLGKVATLNDTKAIPSFAAAMKERFIQSLGPLSVFTAFAAAFLGAKLVAHRKAIVYVVHEVFMSCRKEKTFEEWRPTCLREFLLKIGKMVRGFKADERQSYCRVALEWKKRKCFPPEEFEQLKDSWDLD